MAQKKKDSSLERQLDVVFRSESFKGKNDFEEEMENESGSIDTDSIADKIIDNANQYFLIKILSPEIRKNEDKKRKHKDKLISIVKIFLICQFLILMCLLFGVTIMVFIFHGLNNDLGLDYLEIIIKFISIYITSVVAELIAMLYFIVSNVFDTSITGLVEVYKDATGNKNENILKEQEN